MSSNREFYANYMEYLSEDTLTPIDGETRESHHTSELNSFQRAASIHVLKLTICALNLLNDNRNCVQGADDDKLPSSKSIESELQDDHKQGSTNECFIAMNKARFEADITAICCALQICLEEVQKHDGSQLMHTQQYEDTETCGFLKPHIENVRILIELSNQLKNNKRNAKEIISDLHEKLLRSEIGDKQESAAGDMTEKWENAREEQFKEIFAHGQENAAMTYNDLERRLERELIATREVKNFYQKKCERLENLVKHWVHRYEAERRELDMKVERLQEEIKQITDEKNTIRQLYDERETLIQNYFAEQKLLQERRELEAKQCAAAIKIQSWWRGTMVRKQLGPYRPKKKGKKGKNTKKK